MPLTLLPLLLAAAAAGSAQSLVKDAPTLEDRARLREVVPWPDECEAGHQAAVQALELTEGRVRFFNVGGRRHVVEVACARGAYQESHLYFLLDESATPPKAEPLVLPGFRLDDDEQWQKEDATQVAGESRFDPDRKTLTILTLARGLGDCGRLARYGYRAGKLELVEFRGRACDGDPEQAPPPEQWPRVFPK